MKKNYAIGIDIGTTSTKAVLFDEKGKALKIHSKSYPLLANVPGAAEQEPDEIYDAVMTCLKEVVMQSETERNHIHFISFSTAMHTLIAIDESGRPLTNSYTWADTRSEPYAEKWKKENDPDALYKRTGVPVHPMTPFFKLMWLKDKESDVFNRATRFVSIKDYVFYRWFGEWVTDYATAAATGLWNMQELSWDIKALEMAGVTAEKLPKIEPTTFYWDKLSENLAKESGLPKQVKVVIGATDGPLSNLGVGAISKGDIALTIGTSGAIRTTSSEPVLDKEGRTFCYPLTENHWVSGGPVNNGGLTFQWIHDVLSSVEEGEEKSSFEALSKSAESVPAGAEGLIFLPFLTGERAPLWDAKAKGSFIGLSILHKKEHLVRSVLEGATLNLYQVYQLVSNQAEKEGEVKIFATGGFAESALWRQIVADVFQMKVHIPENTESSCLGAVLLGLFAVGLTKELQEVEEETKEYDIVIPDSEKREVYSDLFHMYQTLVDALSPYYGSMHQFQFKHKKGLE